MRKQKEARWPWLIGLSNKNNGLYKVPSAALLMHELGKRNLRKHVVDSQSVSFDGALKVAKELRGHGLSRADASSRMLDSRAKTLSELASLQPDGAFAFVLDTVRGRPWLWRKLRAKAPPTKTEEDEGVAEQDFKWSESALNFDFLQLKAASLPSNAFLAHPPQDEQDAPHLIHHLEGEAMDRNTFVLWTTDGSAVFNASPELVRYVVAPAGTAKGDWCLVDLDAVSRDPSIKLRNDKLAWRVMNVLIGGDFVDGLPGIGPTRLNRQEDLVELCNSFAALSAGGVEQLLEAASAKAASPYPDIIINGLKKETIEHVLRFECAGIDSLSALLEAERTQIAAAAQAARAERQALAGPGSDLVFALKPRHHEKRRPPRDRTQAATEPTDEMMHDAEPAAEEHRLPYSGKGRPLRFERTDYLSVESPIRPGAEKADRFERLRLSATAPEETPAAAPKRTIKNTDKAIRATFGVTSIKSLKLNVRRKAIQAQVDSDDEPEEQDYDALDEVSGASDVESEASEDSSSIKTDEDLGDEESVTGDVTEDGKAGHVASSTGPDAAEAASGASLPTTAVSAAASASDEQNVSAATGQATAQTAAAMPSTDGQSGTTSSAGKRVDNAKPPEAKTPSKAAAKKLASLDSDSIKKQFKLSTIPIDHAQAYPRLALLDMTSIDSETLEKLRKGDPTLFGAIDPDKRKIGLEDGVELVALNHDLKLVDEAVRAEFAFETPVLFEVLRRSISHALLLSPTHRFIRQAGLGVQGPEKGADAAQFRRVMQSLHSLAQFVAPQAGVTESNSWKQGRPDVPTAERRAHVLEREIAGVHGKAREEAAAAFESEWTTLSEGEQERLARLGLPLFVLQEAKAVLAEQPCIFSTMRSSVFYESWARSHKAATTAMRLQVPAQFEHLAATLASDPFAQTIEFIAQVGEPYGCEIPAATQLPVKCAKAWAITQASPASRTDIARALKPIILAGILGAFVVADEERDARHLEKIYVEIALALERVSPILAQAHRGYGEFMGQRPSSARVIARELAKLVMAVIGVIRQQYRAMAAQVYRRPSEMKRVTRSQSAAGANPAVARPVEEDWIPTAGESTVTIEGWVRGRQELLVNVTGLVEAQLSWRVWKSEQLPLTCHGKALIVPIYEQIHRLEGSAECAKAVVENINFRIDAIEHACSKIDTGERASLVGRIKEAISAPPKQTFYKRERRDGESHVTRGEREPRKTTLQLRGKARAGAATDGADPATVPLVDGLHDRPFVRVEAIKPGAIFPRVTSGPSVAKVKRCAAAILGHLAPRELPRRDRTAAASRWDLLAPFILGNMYTNNPSKEFLAHGDVTYLPDAISILQLAPARIRKGTSRYEGSLHSTENRGRRGASIAGTSKRLHGYTSYGAAKSFTTNTMAFHYQVDSKTQVVTLRRVDAPFAFDQASSGQQNGTWTAAEHDPQGKIMRQFVRTPSSTSKRTTGTIAEEVCEAMQKLVKAELEREATAVKTSTAATPMPPAPPKDEHHTVFAGIDRGEEVLVALVVIGKPGTTEATSFKIKNAQYQERDAQDRAAQERRDAQSPLIMTKTTLEQQGEFARFTQDQRARLSN